MRRFQTVAIAVVAAAMIAPAAAQTRVERNGATVTRGAPHVSQMRDGGWSNGGRSSGARWGNRIGGRWYGGVQAPGGWNAYRRPYRGWALPRYWIAPSFFISDYAAYGLGAPPLGYNWSRYYDDAVLIDTRGRVFDSVSGLDWDRYGDDYAYDDGERYGVGDEYAPPPPADRGAPYDYPDRGPPPVYAPPPVVHNGGGYETRVYSGGSYGYYGGATTIVTVLPTTMTTTETITYYDDVRRYRAPVRRRVIRRAPSKILRRDCSC